MIKIKLIDNSIGEYKIVTASTEAEFEKIMDIINFCWVSNENLDFEIIKE